ncbi:Bax inhibitor-1/YccA family protein [Rothia nasimurium]|uniref:Bax inhibitor-1/YccA family protein n=1 Tax=Rothia nasimurium TaxID=85336 RepID=UPI001F21DC1F|nr:Bax inhibitor-1/YccA family protein [Rothia nasimurium]
MAGNPLINNMIKPAGDPRFGQFGAGGTTTANPYGQPGQYTQNPYGQQAQNPYGTYQQGSYTQQAPYSYQDQQVSAGQLNDMYNYGTATPADTNRITINDIIVKTALNLGLVVVGAVVAWYAPILMFVGMIGGLVLGIVNSLKKKVSPALVMVYSVMEGLLVGGISRMFEAQYPGLVVQAVMATLVVFATILALYSSGKIRATAKMTRFFIVAATAYFIFCMINLVSSLFFETNMRSFEVMGIPLGLIIGLFAVLMATYSLLLDFTHASEAIQAGFPERESWRIAFGLIVSLVWLYIEILRVFYYLRALADD